MGKDCEECKRHRVVLKNGDNFYFTMGDEFIQCCPPFENREENHKLRMMLDDFCDAVTAVLGGSKRCYYRVVNLRNGGNLRFTMDENSVKCFTNFMDQDTAEIFDDFCKAITKAISGE